jgi:hypothetical protein
MIADATTAETVLDDINRMNAAREGLAVLVQHSIDRGQGDAAARYLRAADRGTEELAALHARRIEFGVELPE